MPLKWTGTVQDRLDRMEKSGRRCDANSRHCTRAAVEEYELIPADGQGNPKPDAERVKKKCCSYHRSQFLNSGMWIVKANRQLEQKDPRAHRKYHLPRAS
jgi:hypothetical protein